MTIHFYFLLYLVVILRTMFAVCQMFFNKRIIYTSAYTNGAKLFVSIAKTVILLREAMAQSGQSPS